MQIAAGGPKMQDGVLKGVNPRFLGAPVKSHKVFWSKELFYEKRLWRRMEEEVEKNGEQAGAELGKAQLIIGIGLYCE